MEGRGEEEQDEEEGKKKSLARAFIYTLDVTFILCTPLAPAPPHPLHEPNKLNMKFTRDTFKKKKKNSVRLLSDFSTLFLFFSLQIHVGAIRPCMKSRGDASRRKTNQEKLKKKKNNKKAKQKTTHDGGEREEEVSVPLKVSSRPTACLPSKVEPRGDLDTAARREIQKLKKKKKKKKIYKKTKQKTRQQQWRKWRIIRLRRE